MSAGVVKNPIPRISYFKELYGSISSTIMTGLMFNPWLEPYTLTGKRAVGFNGLFCTLVTTMLVISGVCKAVRIGRYNGEIQGTDKPDKWLMRLPRNRALFGLLVALPAAPLGYLLFDRTFRFFGFEQLNFYQYMLMNMIYSTLLSKVVSRLAIARCLQPDCDPALPHKQPVAAAAEK